jgi:hypothetical protein
VHFDQHLPDRDRSLKIRERSRIELAQNRRIGRERADIRQGGCETGERCQIRNNAPHGIAELTGLLGQPNFLGILLELLDFLVQLVDLRDRLGNFGCPLAVEEWAEALARRHAGLQLRKPLQRILALLVERSQTRRACAALGEGIPVERHSFCGLRSCGGPP